MLKQVTFTGIDNQTNPMDIVALQDEYPFLEFGVLISKKLSESGANNRYPNIDILKNYRDKGLNLSCHLCGNIAREVINNNWEPFYNLIGEYKDIFQRIQINIGGIDNFSDAVIFPEEYQVIIQSTNSNRRMYDAHKHLPNVFGFHDNSGGTGVYDNKWMPSDDAFFGYAGGIGLDNVRHTIQSIMKVNKNDFWIDMESNIRTFEWLDVNKCAAIAEICSRYIRSN